MAETMTQTTEVKVKKKKSKTVLIVLGIILAVIAVAVGVCAIVAAIGSSGNMKFAKAFETVDYTAQLAPEKDADGDWCFTTDKDFKIVQLTDLHLGGGFLSLEKDSNAIQAVASMLKAEQPALVIVTGDVAYPVPFQAGTFNNKTGAATTTRRPTATSPGRTSMISTPPATSPTACCRQVPKTWTASAIR